VKRDNFTLFDHVVKPGTQVILKIPLPNMYSHSSTEAPIYIRHSLQPGPTLLVTGAMHGDEINSIEIIRRLLKSRKSKVNAGTLIAIPIVNIYGFVTLSRYLPDRRDLNRCFPGTEHGSLGSRIAYTFSKEILPKVNFLIDLHTGSNHKSNFPQIRTDASNKSALEMAKAFKAPIIINANIRDGSLREAAASANIPAIVYEGGEALRFDDVAIRYGLQGILNVMSSLKMVSTIMPKQNKSVIAKDTSWLRAKYSGMIFLKKQLGDKISKNEIIGNIYEPFSATTHELISPYNGIIVGKNNLPLITQGDAIINVALLRKDDKVVLDKIEEIMFDEY
jgi:predicted deacylase